ncbi:hypothetical protein D9C73_000071 [Collichthys lucidus]|uniref:Uncharacterized protein n=1 Tax=Collichthys lucidus TaxID=240159 RepID=A0A4U5TZW1_COLLU|nr:hypothetical protein D9C73_000071 [Collichthys lucidus]
MTGQRSGTVEDFPFPNQPVPPPSATWYPGLRYRSYADAVGQPARRWFRPHYGEQDIQDRIQSPREPARKRTVATMTGEAEDQPLQPTDWHQPPLTSHPPSPPGPPRGQRHGRRTRGTVVTEDSFLQDEPEQQDEVRVMEEPPHTPTHSELEAPFDELQAEEEAAAAITSTPQSSVEVTVQTSEMEETKKSLPPEFEEGDSSKAPQTKRSAVAESDDDDDTDADTIILDTGTPDDVVLVAPPGSLASSPPATEDEDEDEDCFVDAPRSPTSVQPVNKDEDEYRFVDKTSSPKSVQPVNKDEDEDRVVNAPGSPAY